MKNKISIVIPFYNEEKILPHLFHRINTVTNDWEENWEVICINDGSDDNTLEILYSFNQKVSCWKILSLSRNFGQQAAISAGLNFVSGDYICIIDADLQDPPELILKFIGKLKEGYDIVYAIRENRKENFIKKISYKIFYILLNKMSSIYIPVDSGDFCVMNKTAINAINELPENTRFVRGLRSWIGFKQIGLSYSRDERRSGKPKYTFIKLFNLALDGLISFSDLPIRLSSILGFILSFITLFIAFIILVIKLYDPEMFIPGTTLTRMLILFLASIQLIFIGILGEYISKIFHEVKKRPIAVIDSMFGFKQDEIIKAKKCEYLLFKKLD